MLEHTHITQTQEWKSAPLVINVILRNKFRKAPHFLQTQNKVLVRCCWKPEKQMTEIQTKLNTVQHPQWPQYTTLLQPNDNLEFEVQNKI